MKYFRIETANGSRYVKSENAIRSSKQAAQLLQEPVVWVHPISPVEYAIKKLVDRMSSKQYNKYIKKRKERTIK